MSDDILSERIDALEKLLNTYVASLDRRVTALEQRLDERNGRMLELAEDLGELRGGKSSSEVWTRTMVSMIVAFVSLIVSLITVVLR